MSEENKAVIRRFVEGIRTGDLDVMDELFSRDFVNRDPSPGFPEDREGYKQVLGKMRAAFSDFQIGIEDLFAEGDKVAVRIMARGTHTNEMMGIAPTGKHIEWTGILIFWFREGKIADRWETPALRPKLGLPS